MDDSKVTCPMCGEQFSSDTRFCPNDGTTLARATTHAGAEADLVGKIVADRYKVVRELGRGAMGTVYLAEHVRMGRRAALKVMNPSVMRDQEAVARFNREASVASRVIHPNVGGTYDFGETADGLVYIAMEYVDGQTLRKLVEEAHGLSLERASNVIRQIAGGLAAAHELSIVHRDLKPDNILVTRDRSVGDFAKIVDFGIAKSVASQSKELTRSGFLVGTPTYMSPEQVSGDPIDLRSDIFSFGLLAFYVLTGKLPYPDGSVQEAFIARLTGAPMTLAEARPDIAWPIGLQEVLNRALARAPADRYQDATEFGKDFARAIYDDSIALPRASKQAPAISLPPSLPPTRSEDRPRAKSRSSLRFVLFGGVALATIAGVILIINFRSGGSPFPGGSPSGGGSPFTSLLLWLPVVVLLGGVAFPIANRLRAPKAIPPSSVSQTPLPSAGPQTAAAPSPTVSAPPALKVSLPPTAAPKPTAAPSSTPSPPPPVRRIEQPGEFTAIFSRDWRKPEDAPSPPPARSSTVVESTGIFGTRESSAASTFPLAIVVNTTVDPTIIGKRVKCDHFPFTVGRSVTANLSIPGDIHLSRIHIEVDSNENGFVVHDLSTNGVYVNGRMLHDTTEAFGIGTTIQLTVNTSLRFVADVPRLPDLTGQLLDTRYRLSQLLHESIKSSTYLANDERIPRSLAVKVFSPALMSVPQYQVEFRRQADLAARLQHPHICKVIDRGEATITLEQKPERVAYLCTEYMGGGNLSAKLGTPDASNPAVTAGWIERIASALQHAHDAGIVHGDVKPNCILFDAHGAPYLTDFALAVEGTSNQRTVVGNPDYLAPEQWDAQSASPRSDQYSLAVLAYFLFCGVPPYEGQADPAVRRRNFERGPVAAHEEAARRGRDGVSRQLSTVLAKAMAVDPATRFESVIEFSKALMRGVSSKRMRSGATRIFLSYQRETSAAWATHLSSALRDRHGYSVFLDTQSTDGAPKIPDRLKEEIRDCDVFVCLLGAKTLESKWVRQEIGAAAKFDKPMVPVFQEGFRAADANTKTRPGVRRLLNYSGVHLFDLKNVYVDDMIAHLNEQIQKLVATP